MTGRMYNYADHSTALYILESEQGYVLQINVIGHQGHGLYSLREYILEPCDNGYLDRYTWDSNENQLDLAGEHWFTPMKADWYGLLERKRKWPPHR